MSDFLTAAEEEANTLKDALHPLRQTNSQFVESLEYRIDQILGLFRAEVGANEVTTSLLEEAQEEQ